MASFPGSVPSLPRPTSTTAMDASGFEGDVVVDLISDEVEAIATELGTDPAGAQATVKARLEAIQSDGLPGGGVWPSTGYVSNAIVGATQSTRAISADRLYLSPWWCPATVTLDRIAVEVTTLQTGATARLGIYSAASGWAASLLLDAGEIDCSTTGGKELTVSQALTGGTLYWLALLNKTGSVSYRATGAGGRGFSDSGVGAGGTNTYAIQTATYGSGLPSDAPSYSYTNMGAASQGPIYFWLRRS